MRRDEQLASRSSTNYVNRQNLLAREPTGLRFKSVVLEGNDMEICATVIARRFLLFSCVPHFEMALPDVDRRHTAHVQAAPPANADWPPPNHIHTHFPPSASHLHSKKKKTTLSPFNHFPLFFYAFYSFLSLIPAYNEMIRQRSCMTSDAHI